jgi:hypothetical protein
LPAGPAASGIPAASDLTCDDLAGLLPRSIEAWPLTWSAVDGAAEPIPGYPVADLAASLGITQADVCAVTFEYASTMNGTIVRFRGADQAGLLEAYIEDVGAATQGKGYQLLTQPLDLSGRPAIELNRDGFDRVAWQVSDLIVEMPTVWAEPVSTHLPGIEGPLPMVAPPAPVPTENPKAQSACAKLYDLMPDDWGSEHAAAQTGVGPDAIAGTGYNGEDASPAIMTDGLLDTLGIGPFEVCRMEFQYGDTDVSTGRVWKLGKGGAATLQPYLDDLAATLQAGGATVVTSTEKVGKRTVSTLTVAGPAGTSTWYYAPAGTAFVEFQTEQEARRMLPLLPKNSKE